MKGRARQQNAKFFVFEGRHHNSPLTLNNVRAIEARVGHFLATRSVPLEKLQTCKPANYCANGVCETMVEETLAARRGFYEAK